MVDWIEELNAATSERGIANFTAAERQTMQTFIVNDLNRVYEGTNLNFVTSQPAGPHDTISMGATFFFPGVLGSAILDTGNRTSDNNDGEPPEVYPRNYADVIDVSFGVSREETVLGLANALAGTAAHELGHSFGMEHHFVYSNEGISPQNNNLLSTGGLQTQHLLNTQSTGSTNEIRRAGGRTLSPYSQVMVDVAGGSPYFQQFSEFDNPSLVDNPITADPAERLSGDAGDTNATAQTLSFQMGTLSKKLISFVEADLDGTTSDVDYFRLDVTVDSVLSSHVLSDQLRVNDLEFDPTLTLLDSNGTEIAFADDTNWDLNTFVVDQSVPNNGSDRSFAQDAALFNINLTPGTYFLKVTPAQVNIGQPAAVGDLYFLLTSLDATVVLGDVNQDGIVNFLDISPLINLLTLGVFQAEADINGDGMVNFLDISPFITLLTSS